MYSRRRFWKFCFILSLCLSGVAQAQNILVLTTRGKNTNATDPESNFINTIVDEFAAPFDNASCNTTPQTGIDPVSGLPKTVTCNHTDLVNGTAMSPALFNPGYDLVIVASAYTTIDAVDWPILQQAIQNRGARGFMLFVDSYNNTNNGKITPLLNAILKLSGTAAITMPTNTAAVFDSKLNTAATGAGDFTALNPFRLCGDCRAYNKVPAESALYLSQNITGPISSGTTNAVGLLIPQNRSFPSAAGLSDGAGACVFSVNDIGWGKSSQSWGWAENHGKVGTAFLKSLNNAAGPCARLGAIAAELKVTKTTAAPLPSPPVNGTDITYSVDVENTSAAAIATNIGVADSQPPGLSFGVWSCIVLASGLPAAVCPSSLPASGSLSTTIASLPPGGKLRFTVTATVTDATEDNSNTATITPPINATCQGNQCSSTVSLPGAVELDVAKTVNVTSLTPGGSIEYTIVVSNTGQLAAGNVQVNDPMVTGLSSQTWTCTGAACPSAGGSGAINETIVSLPAGDSVTYTIYGIAGTALPPNVINTVTIDADYTVCASTNAPAPCSASAVVPPVPVVELLKTATDQTRLGGPVTYTVAVNNIGAVAADGTIVSDLLPPGIVDYAWTCTGTAGAGCPNASGSGAINETIAVFPATSAVVYEITAQTVAQPPASITNTVTAAIANGGLCAFASDYTASPCTASATSSMVLPVVPVPAANPAAMILLAVLLAMCGYQRSGAVRTLGER